MSRKYVPINVILADDHEIFRDGFRVMLNKIEDVKLIGEASNGEELIEKALSLKPDIVITDIKMPVMNGIEATKRLVKELPGVGIIALSMFDEENLIVDMLEAGAKGYLLKNVHKEEVIAAVKSVYMEKPYYCRDTSNKLAQIIAKSHFNPYKKNVPPQFSELETAVIKMICKEYSTKEMADELKLSQRTVENYRRRILEKTDAKNTVGIVVFAMKNNLFE
jgi:DNA-binding NarL/FixJ family response regulator